MNNHAIIVAGGIGSRMKSNIPKQYYEVNGIPIYLYSFRKFASCPEIKSITIVLSDEWKPYVQAQLSCEVFDCTICYAKAGPSRQHSVLNGLNAIKGIARPDDLVFVHDSVRPLFPLSAIYDGIEACSVDDVALPVISAKDATYHSSDGKRLLSILPREELFFGQSPECMVYGKILSAHAQFSEEELSNIHGCSELALRANLSVKLITGSESNFKITTIEDLKAFEGIVCNINCQ